MSVSVKDGGVCRKVITIEIPADIIAEKKAETLKLYIKGVNIPGFRKGKAPRHVVEKKFKKEIAEDIRERLVPLYYRDAVQETNLKVNNVIDVTEVEIEDDKPLVFDVTVDVDPEFKLPKYEGIPVKDEKEQVTDAMVHEQIDAIRGQYAEYKSIEGQPVNKGDMAELTYDAVVDGTPLSEVVPEAKGVGKGDGYWVSADEHAFLPGMGEAIIGMNIGEKKDVEVAFPEDFAVKELSGIKALYTVEATAIRVRTLPEINEEFLNRLKLKSEEELRQRICENLEHSAEQKATGKKFDQIIEFLLSKTALDVPESAVQQQTRNMMYDIARQRVMMGQTQEQIGEQQEEILKEAEAKAIETVKIRYIGLAIADELKLEASEQEVNEEISRIAVQERRDARTLRKEMEENGSLHSVGEQIRFNKALDYLLENAKVK